MRNNPVYIQVILPLKLEWEPYYYVEDGLPISVGERVEVRMAGRRYSGVVSAVDVTPDPAIKKILPAQRSALPAISREEILFWQKMAQYYLCTVGELYKAAYPQQKQESEEVAVRVQERLENRLAALQQKEQKARKDSTRQQYRTQIERIQALLAGKESLPDARELTLSLEQEEAVQAMEVAFSQGKTVLLEADGQRRTLYLELARRILVSGKSVLYLVPEIGLSRQLEEDVERVFPQVMPYHSGLTVAQRRGVSQAVRGSSASLVLGTRSALFLPYSHLGLIVVDDEQDTSYKQDAPAPRYHARETAILLAQAHGAHVVLGGETPSLESLYNADIGLFTKVQLQEGPAPETLLVNTAAEIRKKGVSGSFSLKLLTEMHRCLDTGEKVLLVCRSRASIPDCTAELEPIFGARTRGITLCTPATAKGQPSGAFALVAVLQADFLLAREDFRCDERAMQVLSLFRSRCIPGGLLVVQTFEPAHPAFGLWNGDTVERLLQERRTFGFPPYTRLVQVVIRDSSKKRLSFMSQEFLRSLRPALPQDVSIVGPNAPSSGETDVLVLRITLQRDKALKQHKQTISSTVNSFEKARKYVGHIHLDVDPV